MRTTWGKLALLNGAALIGAAISLFTVPSRTPLWTWAGIVVATFAILNYVALRRSKNSASGASTSGLGSWIVILFGLLILAVDVIWSNWRR